MLSPTHPRDHESVLKLSLMALLFSTAAFGYAASDRATRTADRNASAASFVSPPFEPTQLQCRPESSCCKICSKGKACGDSCISHQKACHAGRGCACNASELCE